MTVIFPKEETKFDAFINGLTKFPFVRIALFCAIAGIVFDFLDMKIISMVFFYIIPSAIIARISTFYLSLAEHPVTKFWTTSLFVATESGAISIALDALGKVGGLMEEAVGVASPVISTIAWAATVLAGIGFLIRIFVALFIR